MHLHINIHFSRLAGTQMYDDCLIGVTGENFTLIGYITNLIGYSSNALCQIQGASVILIILMIETGMPAYQMADRLPDAWGHSSYPATRSASACFPQAASSHSGQGFERFGINIIRGTPVQRVSSLN